MMPDRAVPADGVLVRALEQIKAFAASVPTATRTIKRSLYWRIMRTSKSTAKFEAPWHARAFEMVDAQQSVLAPWHRRRRNGSV